MINIKDIIYEYKIKGYSQAHATARVVQDILLMKLSKSIYKNNVTIKGGVVMFNITKQIRRATVDIDIDFIHYAIDDKSIERLFDELNKVNDSIILKINYPIKELKQLDYSGRRILFTINDTFGNIINNAKLDFGVHKHIDIKQEEFIFQIESLNQTTSLLINTKEQIVAEKLSSLLRHGIRSTRYKDIYDIYFLITETELDVDDVMFILNKMELDGKYIDLKEMNRKLDKILNNSFFCKNASKPNNQWIDCTYEKVVERLLLFFS